MDKYLGYIGVFLVLVLTPQTTWATEATEGPANEISVSFYQMSADKWNSVKDQFLTTLTTKATAFCKTNLDTCGVDKWPTDTAFVNADVNITASEKMAVKDGYAVTFYLRFPAALPAVNRITNKFVLTLEALDAVATDSRSDFNDKVGSVIEVNGVSYSPPPNAMMNWIMVPIAIAVLLFFIILVVALHCHAKYIRKKKKKDAKKGKKSNRPAQDTSVSSTTKIAPAPTTANEHWKIDETAKGDGRPIRSLEDGYDDEHGYNTQTTYMSDTGHTVNIPDPNRNNSLPPLEGEEEQRKKRKEKKRKRKREKKEEGGENQAFVEAELSDEKEMNIPVIQQPRDSDSDNDHHQAQTTEL